MIRYRDLIEIPLGPLGNATCVPLELDSSEIGSVLMGVSLLPKESVTETRPLKPDDIISIQFVTADLVEKGKWVAFKGYGHEIPVPAKFEEISRNGFRGAKILLIANAKSMEAQQRGALIWMDKPYLYKQALLKTHPLLHSFSQRRESAKLRFCRPIRG